MSATPATSPAAPAARTAAAAAPAPSRPASPKAAPAATAPKPAAINPATTPAPGTSVSSASSRQVLVATNTGCPACGTITAYQWTGSSWQTEFYAAASFGAGGMNPGTQRAEGDLSTPEGTYPILSEFGIGNPGTKELYSTIDSCSWWIENPADADYNRWREDCALTTAADSQSEHLIVDTSAVNGVGQYDQAAVIGFNYASPIRTGPGSGSGIFLHYTPHGGVTAGCVGVNDRATLIGILRWADPAANPVIVIN